MADCTATSQLPEARDLQLLLMLQSWAASKLGCSRRGRASSSMISRSPCMGLRGWVSHAQRLWQPFHLEPCARLVFAESTHPSRSPPELTQRSVQLLDQQLQLCVFPVQRLVRDAVVRPLLRQSFLWVFSFGFWLFCVSGLLFLVAKHKSGWEICG